MESVYSAVRTIPYTGHFIIFSVTANICNKKTKGPTLMELFTATGKLKSFFFYHYTCSVCAPRVTRHTSIRYSAFNGWPLDFWLHRQPVSVNCLYHTQMVLSVGGSFVYFARNARCTGTTSVIFQHTKWLFPPEPPFSNYIHSHRLAAEMRTTIKKKQFTGGKWFLSCSFYLYRFCKYVSYGFPIINFCNPGVHYETPCIKQITFRR